MYIINKFRFKILNLIILNTIIKFYTKYTHLRDGHFIEYTCIQIGNSLPHCILSLFFKLFIEFNFFFI